MENRTDEELTVKRAAVVITVQSWGTPIIGLLMLVVGLLAGYYSRPLLSPQAAGSAAGRGTASPSASPVGENVTAQQAALMQEMVAKTRYFKGDPNAPVTVLEFSDFQ
jgi:protein-disulfide isomerase